MLVIREYDREHAVQYAKRYAFSQNPLFGNFRGIGGNCTNFTSQCLYAGCCQMNYRQTFGWYYISLNERAPAWTGVDYFYRFLVNNSGVGPFGRDVALAECEIGDIIQLYRKEKGFYHTLLIVGFNGEDPLIAAQTDDAYERALSSYTYDSARFLHIDGARMKIPDSTECYQNVYDGIALVQDADS